MTLQETIQILVPRAGNLAYGNILTRPYIAKIFVRRDNAYTLARLEEIHYAPAWAQVRAIIYQSNKELLTVAGSGGKIEIEHDFTEHEPQEMSLENRSIDTEVRFSLRFRSWQYGEQ